MQGRGQAPPPFSQQSPELGQHSLPSTYMSPTVLQNIEELMRDDPTLSFKVRKKAPYPNPQNSFLSTKINCPNLRPGL